MRVIVRVQSPRNAGCGRGQRRGLIVESAHCGKEKPAAETAGKVGKTRLFRDAEKEIMRRILQRPVEGRVTPSGARRQPFGITAPQIPRTAQEGRSFQCGGAMRLRILAFKDDSWGVSIWSAGSGRMRRS
jgi:hypothetical protein